MSRFIDPRCGVPIFMMDNPRIARRCGRINGFFTAMSFTIFFIIGTVILTIHLNKKQLDPDTLEVIEADKNKKFIWWPIVTGIGCIIFSWIFFPFLTGYFYTIQYKSKEIEKGRMRRRGLNEKEVYKQQQDLYEKRLETSARLKAAEIQADAMRDAFRRR
jgi:hypothetical protein